MIDQADTVELGDAHVRAATVVVHELRYALHEAERLVEVAQLQLPDQLIVLTAPPALAGKRLVDLPVGQCHGCALHRTHSGSTRP